MLQTAWRNTLLAVLVCYCFSNLILCEPHSIPMNFSVLSRGSNHIPHRKGAQRNNILCFIGVQTSFGYQARRKLLRETWFPPTPAALEELEKTKKIVTRFVIGFSSDAMAMNELEDEVNEYGGFLRLAVKEQYSRLTLKTYLFMKAVMSRYNPEYLFKADDDIYLQVDRIPVAIPQWKHLQKDYIGCFMVATPVLQPGGDHPREYDRWIEPQYAILPGMYPTYARGSLYALSQKALRWLMHLPDSSVRFWRSEDVTVGIWMVGLNVTQYEDLRMCSEFCEPASIAVYNVTCNGLCNLPGFIKALDADEKCHEPPITDVHGFMPLWPSPLNFTKLDKFGGDMAIYQR